MDDLPLREMFEPWLIECISLSCQLAARRQVPAVLQFGELQVAEEGLLVQRAE